MKVEEIAEAISKLTPDQLARFRRWFIAFEAGRRITLRNSPPLRQNSGGSPVARLRNLKDVQGSRKSHDFRMRDRCDRSAGATMQLVGNRFLRYASELD